MRESKNGVKDAETKQSTWESNTETKLGTWESKSSVMLRQSKAHERARAAWCWDKARHMIASSPGPNFSQRKTQMNETAKNEGLVSIAGVINGTHAWIKLKSLSEFKNKKRNIAKQTRTLEDLIRREGIWRQPEQPVKLSFSWKNGLVKVLVRYSFTWSLWGRQ